MPLGRAGGLSYQRTLPLPGSSAAITPPTVLTKRRPPTINAVFWETLGIVELVPASRISGGRMDCRQAIFRFLTVVRLI